MAKHQRLEHAASRVHVDRQLQQEDAGLSVRCCIVQEEREDQALRKAEMEAQKATNMIDHEDEIQARPARTWFQTEQQKKRQKVLAREASSDRPGSGKGAAGGKQAKNAESKKLCKGDKDRAEKRQKANEARDEVRARCMLAYCAEVQVYFLHRKVCTACWDSATARPPT